MLVLYVSVNVLCCVYVSVMLWVGIEISGSVWQFRTGGEGFGGFVFLRITKSP